MGELVFFWNLNQCVQMIRHEKNQGAVPAMGEVVVFCTLEDEWSACGMGKLMEMPWAGADGDEKFGVLNPIGNPMF